MAVPILKSPNLTMRGASADDAELRFALGHEHPEILRMYGVSPDRVEPLTRERAENWARSLMDHPYAWVIESNVLLGTVRLDKVDLRDRRASLAIGLFDYGQLGKGYGTEAAREVLRFGFEQLGLHRVSLRVLAYNERAIRSYKKCGFKVEGRERETAFVDGAWHDDLIMGVLEHEFMPAA